MRYRLLQTAKKKFAEGIARAVGKWLPCVPFWCNILGQDKVAAVPLKVCHGRIIRGRISWHQ